MQLESPTVFAFVTPLWPLLAELTPAATTAIGAVVSAIVGGIVALLATRYNQGKLASIQAQNQVELARIQAELAHKNQSQLTELQGQLTRQNQLALAERTAELADTNQTRLEALKSQLSTDAQQKLDLFRAKLAEQKTEADALREYRFDAHKKLYAACEPLLFNLAEFAEGTVGRVRSLARTARQGNLPNWLRGDGYYKLSTMYRLILPLVVFRLFQQRLTFIDLSLDPHIANQYALLKLSYLAWKDDYEFSDLKPKLDYDPNERGSEGPPSAAEAIQWPQGLVLGVLDNTIDALLRPDRQPPWMTYGEFETAVQDKKSPTHSAFRYLADMLVSFHPQRRPVLWRILVAQSLIYSKLLEAHSAGKGTLARLAPGQIMPLRPRKPLDWRADPEEGDQPTVTKMEAVTTPYKVAMRYLRARLPAVFVKETPEISDPPAG